MTLISSLLVALFCLTCSHAALGPAPGPESASVESENDSLRHELNKVSTEETELLFQVLKQYEIINGLVDDVNMLQAPHPPHLALAAPVHFALACSGSHVLPHCSVGSLQSKPYIKGDPGATGATGAIGERFAHSVQCMQEGTEGGPQPGLVSRPHKRPVKLDRGLT